MNNFKVFLGILLLSAVISCCSGTKENSYIDFDSFENAELLLLHGDYDLLSPQFLSVVGSRLLVSDKHEGKLITSISLDSLSVSERVANVGNGPHEFQKIAAISRFPNSNVLTINDDIRRTISRYSLDEGFCLTEHSFLGRESYLNKPDILSLSPLPDGYLSIGGFPDGLFGFFNKEFEQIQVFGPIPGENDLVSSKAFAMRNQGTLAVSPDGGYFCYAAIYSDMLSFYELKGGCFVPSKTYSSFSPDVDILTQSFNGMDYVAVTENGNSVRGYRDIYATDRHFYALYFGIPANKLNEAKECYVLKFTKKGELVQGYRFNMLLKSIAVDSESGTLYALSFSFDGNEGIYFCHFED